MNKAMMLLAAVSIAACSNPTAPPKPVPNDTGTYILSMVNGTPVPFAINKNNVIVSGRTVLNSDKSYVQTITSQDSLKVNSVVSTSGTYSIVNTELFLYSTTGRGAVGDGVLIFTNTRQFKFVK